ncbi:hypothetical protein [Nocardioides sp. YIM 152315]|uniref:hypothetical protein n=1 Tax=Nocardioides sp. YIM 152315 TaxID=3031760 RepID=UPI0023D9C20B|nr:hypothetical protein [Nocardioides sp. YIM 152315]MDF1603187.1 hypothetical protein [Nocardioides sp. YIM 152315]
MLRSRLSGALTAVAAAAGLLVALPPPAQADGPGSGTPWVVTLGDSYISGEAGRWAGSSNDDSARADALGPSAYHDAGDHEAIERCHRSRSAEAYIGGGVSGLNLACSGAQTATTSGDHFKPGLDFHDDGAGHLGQAAMLQRFAGGHNVGMVVVSIGGNDFGFADTVQSCVVDFLTSPTWAKNFCHDDVSVTARFAPANVAAVRARIAGALQNVATAMRDAGYADAQWTLLVQSYPSPIPRGDGFRYSQSGYSRQFTGGCGFWNADADWANDTALPTINGAVLGAVIDSGLTNTRTLDLASAFDGRRLCESSVGLYEERGIEDWTSPGAVDQTEWVNQIRTISTCCADSPYYIQESIHPNYWGQLATRSCVRQAWNDGDPRGGTCTIAGTGLQNGEPVMSLH